MAEAPNAQEKPSRTAGEDGWHVSRYNLSAPVPGTRYVAIANLFKGTCARYTPIELYLFSVVEELDEHHPIIERFAKRGIICNHDERAALQLLGRAACMMRHPVELTICPTLGCNFDCPYCFEDHHEGRMSPEVQDDVVALAERMLDACGTNDLHVTWFGGEPLLAPDIIESLSERLMALSEGRGGTYEAVIVTNGYLLTQRIADMLGAAKVSKAQVTIDGLADTHNMTRYLRGGKPTFDRITNNLRTVKLPFVVDIRHNVHEGNRSEVEPFEAFVAELARESGNRLHYYPAPVTGSDVADRRGKQVGLLCETNASDIGIILEAQRFKAGHGHYCGAASMWSVCIDERGNLCKCWEAVDKQATSFGTAHDWDPAQPFETASRPDNLVAIMNMTLPLDDDECNECVWLPMCAGGCPYKRLYETRSCVSFKDDPEAYVLALHARIGEDKAADKKEEPEE